MRMFVYPVLGVWMIYRGYLWMPGGCVYEDVFSYLVGVERSNTGDLAAPVDTELCEGDDDDIDEDCDYYVDDDFDVDGEHRAL